MSDIAPDDGGGESRLDKLIQTASEQAVALARQEISLAREEVTAKAREAAPGVAMLGAAGLLGTLATGTGTAGLVMLLGRRPRPWAAALTVTGLYTGAGAVLAKTGIERLRAVGPPIPEETMRSIKADVRWMRRLVGRRRG